MAFIKHLFNGATVSVYELGDLVKIGRSVENNIVIDDPIVSGFHAELALNNHNNYQLNDLKSTNGTFARGGKISHLELDDGAHFTIGAHEFEFHSNVPNDLDKTLKIKKSWIPGVYFTE